MREDKQHISSSSEKMNPRIDPDDPLGMINYCLYGYDYDRLPVFFTRSDREKIESFLRDEKESSFTLQSGENLSREEIKERLKTYENSIYRAAALNRIFFILKDCVLEVLKEDGHRKELELEINNLVSQYENESKEQKNKEVEHTLLLREEIGKFISEHSDSLAREKLEKAINDYDERYGTGINNENAGKAIRILLNTIEALDYKDPTIGAFKDKAIRITYMMNSKELIEKVRNVLTLAKSLLEKEGFR